MYPIYGEERRLLGVLRELEKAARTPNLYLMDLREIFRLERWAAFSDIKLDLSSTNFDRQILDASSTSRLMASTYEVDAMMSMLVTLLDAANHIQSRLKQQQSLIVAKLAKGIDSLPDELLSLIFRFAVWEERRHGGRQAIWLSHVSSRFRKIAVEEHQLWTTLRLLDSGRQIETFISRSGPISKFHIFMHCEASTYEYHITKLVQICSPILLRWESLSLSEEPLDWYDENTRSHPLSVGSILACLKSLAKDGANFQGLVELNVEGDNSGYNSENIKLTWMSNLNSLRCSYFLPSHAVDLASITTFTFTQDMSHSDSKDRIKALLAALSSMPNVGSFICQLQFGGGTVVDNLPHAPHILKTTCPALSSFHLHLQQLTLSSNGWSERAFASLFRALRLPVLKDLSISISIRPERNHIKICTESLNLLSRALLPSPDEGSHNCLSSLTYSITKDDSDYQHFGHGTEEYSLDSPLAFRIPLGQIPHVTSFTLLSNTRILFTRERGEEVSCCLAEISFVGCDELDAEDLGWTVVSLQDAKAWDAVERVVVTNCANLKYEEILDVVGESRLEYHDSSTGWSVQSRTDEV